MIRKFLSRRRKGALAMVAVAGMVPVTAMMSANLNTSQMVDDRRQMQDASDALARMHGMWTARALNIISMNNVSAAQLLSVAVGSEALLLASNELIFTAGLAGTHITIHGVRECRPRTTGPAALIEAVIWTAPCTAWHAAVAVPASLAAARAADILSDFDPVHGLRTATKALEAIDGMNKSLAARHPRAMAEISESYYGILDLDDHHFADPCNGPQLGGRCDRTNSRDGMALPIEEADYVARGQLIAFMDRGVTSTFRERGFGWFQGPMSAGGSSNNRRLRDHINSVTEIGTALYELKDFYSSRYSDLPRHPFSGPGNAIGGGRGSQGQPEDEGTPFDDDTTDMLDGLRDALEGADDITRQVLEVLRDVMPLAFDRHPSWANLQGTQNRTRSNSFTRWFRIMKYSILDTRREFMPVSLVPYMTAAPVPETFRLKDIDISSLLPTDPSNFSPNDITLPNELSDMPDAYRILAYGLKEKSRRLGQAIMTSPVTTHTGYAQVGVFNPDGATLFTQNWHARLMPATRMDNPAAAGNALGSEARGSFDALAEDLQQVQDTSSWRRVNAH